MRGRMHTSMRRRVPIQTFSPDTGAVGRDAADASGGHHPSGVGLAAGGIRGAVSSARWFGVELRRGTKEPNLTTGTYPQALH